MMETITAIKVGDKVRWTELTELRGNTQYMEDMIGKVEWVDKGSMATPEPTAVVLLLSVFAYAEGQNKNRDGRYLPVQPNSRKAVSTEILKADR